MENVEPTKSRIKPNSTLGFIVNNKSRVAFMIFNTLFMLLFAGAVLIPLLKVLADSLDAASGYELRIIPKVFSLGAYKRVLDDPTLIKSFLVSVETTVFGTLLALLLTTMGAFVLTKKDLPGRKLIIYLVLFTMLFNGGLIPTYMVVKNLHLTNSLFAIILPLCVNTYYLILIKNFFSELPPSVSESAEIDGCSPMGIFFKIILPMSKPVLAAIGLFYMVNYWNDFFHFMMYISDHDLWNFQLKLREMVLTDDRSAITTGNAVSPNALKSAAIVIAIIPIGAVYPFIQKHFISGLNLGAIKE